jgi:type IV pilus assembly protein PilY1
MSVRAEASAIAPKRRSRLTAGLFALGGAVLATLAAADDTEVFLNQAAQNGVRPNVLFIVDTSGSMDSLVDVTKAPYDYTQTYGGACDSSRDFFATASSGGAPPPCDGSARSVPAASDACAASRSALRGRAGLWTGKLAQWDPDRVGWQTLRPDATDPVECEADAGVDGPNAASALRYARNGDPRNLWTANANDALSWATASVYTLYSGNYLNWYNAPAQAAQISRLDIVKSVATSIAYSVDNLNLGLMRYSAGAKTDDFSEGGMVVHEVSNVSTTRDSIVEALQAFTADGFTPLSETLYEAGQYLAGRKVDYGLASTVEDAVPFPSVPASRRPDDPSYYKSPIQYSCQRNFVVQLTDGEPTSDSTADDKIPALPDFGKLGRSACTGTGEGHCLDDMAEYLNKAADLAPSLAGRQNATVYTIGFGPEVVGTTFLQTVAEAGGGRSFVATDVTQLTTVMQNIFGEILQSGATFASPSVSINQFNRTQSSNELYVSVFKPRDTLRWHGNVKKYGILNGAIVDASGQAVVDPATGFLREGTRSLWSDSAETDVVESGGAVSQLPEPDQRRMYTWSPAGGQADLTAPINSFSVANTAGLTDAALNVVPNGPTRADLIGWARTIDTADENGNGNRTETLKSMGDPLHARPALVTYGGTTGAPSSADSVVYVPTNDGFLHAFDARTGKELWAFIPPELVGRITDLYRNPSVAARTYGLDADIRVLRFDVNQDGIVDASAGDRVWIYFGMRRGGRHYYALDVTDRARPRLKWDIGPAQLPGIGETWSTPTITRMRIQGATQNAENLVAIFGGGYDDAQENYQYTTDSSGNAIYVVDASSGALLWSAGPARGAFTPDLVLPRMTQSIPGRIVALDTNGDQYADRLYAADLGGRIWRFDVLNGNSRNLLATGGVLATLGDAETGSTAIQNNRRFYYAPDVALIQRRGADPYYNIAIGSGYRGHPLHTETRDRFYSLRDRNPFGRLTQAQYDALVPVTDAQLVDISDNPGSVPVPATAAGWRLELRLNGGWVGEKVLAESITVDGTILFTTFQPDSGPGSDPCVPSNGVNRAYAVGVDNGRASVDFNGDHTLDSHDISTRLAQSGIAGEVSIALESVLNGPNPDPNQSTDGLDPLGRRGFCVVGVEVLKRCVVPGSVVRTYWQRTANNSAD